MTSNDKLFSITGGPSKFDLMLSLFDGNKEPRRTIEFQLKDLKSPITVAIMMIEQEDGSGESWNFSGRTIDYRANYQVKGCYSSKGRTGHLSFVVPYHEVWNSDTAHFDRVVNPEDERKLEEFVKWLRSE